MHPVLQSGPSIFSEPPIERETEASVRSAPGVLFHFMEATRPPPAWAVQACDLPHIHIHPFSSASPSPRGLTAADWTTSTCFVLWSCFLRKTTTGFTRSWRVNFLSGTWILPCESSCGWGHKITSLNTATEATGGVESGPVLWDMPPATWSCIVFSWMSSSWCPAHHFAWNRYIVYQWGECTSLLKKMWLLVSIAPTAPCSMFYTTEVLNTYFSQMYWGKGGPDMPSGNVQ